MMPQVNALKAAIAKVSEDYPDEVIVLSKVDAGAPASDKETRTASANVFEMHGKYLVAVGTYMAANGLAAAMIRSAVTFIMTLTRQPVNLRIVKSKAECLEFVGSSLAARNLQRPNAADLSEFWDSSLAQPKTASAVMRP